MAGGCFTSYSGGMPITRLVHTLEKRSAVPRDEVVNVWHFWHPFELTVELAQKIGFAVSAFYSALNTELSSALERTLAGQRLVLSALTIGAAGPEDDVLAPAVYSFEDSLTSGTPPVGAPMPNEVALCMSFSSDLTDVPEESGGGTMRPAARRRGRLFLGPWQANCCDAHPATFEPRVLPAVATKVLTSYQSLITALQNPATPGVVPQRVSHIVYSPTTALEWGVTQVWVDSEWDTMRSRGVRGFGKTAQDVVQSRALV
jgi:hypothetical protein